MQVLEEDYAMKTKLQPGTVPAMLRADLDYRFRSKEEASIVLDIPLFRLRKACRGDMSALTADDLMRLSPVLTDDTRSAMREYVLP